MTKPKMPDQIEKNKSSAKDLIKLVGVVVLIFQV